MNNKKIEKKYNKKIKELIRFNKLYYDKSNPAVDDNQYDELKKEILSLEKKYKFLKNENSPLKIVGYKPSKNFKKVIHRVPMLSLANAFDEKDLKNFEKRMINYLNLENDFKIEFSAEPKIDGISASLTYKNGKLITGLSRGDGSQGEDITENLKTIKDIPHLVKAKDFPDEIDIRGEVYIQNSDFKKFDTKFANPRNAASGSLRQKNSEETKKIPLKFIAYTFGYAKDLSINTQSEYLKKLGQWGFKLNPFNKTITGINNLLKNHDEVEKKRKDLDFDIDGIVYKVNQFKLQKRLGSVANAPRWAIAHKFSANYGISEIMNIEIQIGRTGALTPVAKIKPINIGGVLVSNATLHNEDEIKRKDIRIGDIVKIERAGDVIPHVVSVDIDKRKEKSKKFVFPQKCPCGFDTIKEFNNITKKFDAVRRCPDRGFDCDKIAKERLKHFVSKEAFNIDGLGKKIVENFWELKLIRLPQDIFNLDYNKIEKMEGWGRQSVSNLKYSIDTKKKISFDRFIYSLGIRHIGLESAKLISKNLKKFKNFLKISDQKELYELLNIDGIGDTQICSIKNFFSNKTNLKVLNELKKVLIIDDAIVVKNDGLLSNKTFMLTGKLEGMSRSEAKSLIEKNSGSIISNVSKKLDYLIIGNKPTKRKIDAAKELNIKILNQNEWLQLLNKTS